MSTCMFIAGDPRKGAGFCGQPVARPGCPYCPTCAAIAYRRDPKRRPVLRKSQPRNDLKTERAP
jgi:hypothetical protein